MSHRLQVLIPEELDARILKASQRDRISKGQWVRRAVEEALRRPAGYGQPVTDPVAKLSSLAAPTADIEQMLAEIEAGRS
jgi:hypothetical protein